MTRADIVRRNARSLGWLATLFGITIIACHIESGDDRWSAAAWAFALEIPGSPASWGVVILTAGSIILYGDHTDRRRIRIIGARLGFWWFSALMAAALIAFGGDLFGIELHTVNPLAIITWGGLATMYRVHIKDERALPET